MIKQSMNYIIIVEPSKLQAWANRLYGIEQEAVRMGNSLPIYFHSIRRVYRAIYHYFEKSSHKTNVVIPYHIFRIWVSRLRDSSFEGLASDSDDKYKILYLKIRDSANDLEDYSEDLSLVSPITSDAGYSSKRTFGEDFVKLLAILFYLVIISFFNGSILFLQVDDGILVAGFLLSELVGLAALLKVIDSIMKSIQKQDTT